MPKGKWIPPESGDAPKAVKDILAAVYADLRDKWAEAHPDDIENDANKTSSAQQAWAAVKNAGWEKNKAGKWVLKECAPAEVWDPLRSAWVQEGGPGSGRYPAGSAGNNSTASKSSARGQSDKEHASKVKTMTEKRDAYETARREFLGAVAKNEQDIKNKDWKAAAESQRDMQKKAGVNAKAHAAFKTALDDVEASYAQRMAAFKPSMPGVPGDKYIREEWDPLRNEWILIKEGGPGSGRYPAGSSGNSEKQGKADPDSNPASWGGMGSSEPGMGKSESRAQKDNDTRIKSETERAFSFGNGGIDDARASRAIERVAKNKFYTAHNKQVAVDNLVNGLIAAEKAGAVSPAKAGQWRGEIRRADALSRVNGE